MTGPELLKAPGTTTVLPRPAGRTLIIQGPGCFGKEQA